MPLLYPTITPSETKMLLLYPTMTPRRLKCRYCTLQWHEAKELIRVSRISSLLSILYEPHSQLFMNGPHSSNFGRGGLVD